MNVGLIKVGILLNGVFDMFCQCFGCVNIIDNVFVIYFLGIKVFVEVELVVCVIKVGVVWYYCCLVIVWGKVYVCIIGLGKGCFIGDDMVVGQYQVD